MIWITILSVIVTFGIITFNVQPIWVQYVAVAINITLVLPLFFQEFVKIAFIQKWFAKWKFAWLVCLLLIIVNVVTRKYEYIWDFSTMDAFSLKNESITWLSKLDKPVKVLIFARRTDQSYPYVQFLGEQLEQYSKLVNFEVVNINKEVNLASMYGVNYSGETVLVSDDQWVKVKSFEENYLIPGMISLFAKKGVEICSVIGHGEPDPDNPQSAGLSTFKETLENYGYRVKPIQLADFPTVASLKENCSIVFLISPKLNFLDQELITLKNALSEDVPFFMALDPPLSKGLAKVLETFGVRFSEQFVVDKGNLAKQVPITDLLIGQYLSHTITSALKHAMYLPKSQAIYFENSRGLSWQSLLKAPPTDQYALLNSDTSDTVSSFDLITLSIDQESRPRMVIVGTGGSFVNENIHYGDNLSFMTLTTRWLLDEKIEIWESDFDRKEKYLSMSDHEMGVIRAVSLFSFPGISFFVFFLILYTHRRKYTRSRKWKKL